MLPLPELCEVISIFLFLPRQKTQLPLCLQFTELSSRRYTVSDVSPERKEEISAELFSHKSYAYVKYNRIAWRCFSAVRSPCIFESAVVLVQLYELCTIKRYSVKYKVDFTLQVVRSHHLPRLTACWEATAMALNIFFYFIITILCFYWSCLCFILKRNMHLRLIHLKLIQWIKWQ